MTAALAVPNPASNPLAPIFDLGFGNPYLVNNDYRVSYALDAAGNPDGALPVPVTGRPLAAKAPTQTLRNALYVNDLRNGAWAPTAPTLLCGGDADPTVFFDVNTVTMAQFWSQLPAGLITVLDVGATPAAPFAQIQAGFQGSQAQLLAFYESTSGGGLSPAQAQAKVIEGYHSNVAPFCAAAARAFFSQF